jgi:DNA-binding transcriptional LysR family regulator
MLLTLARTGKLVTAATLLGIDHTTLRRRLSRLERALGATLVEHGPEGWVLTDSGRLVAKHAAPLEQIVQSVCDAVAGESTIRGTVRISAPDGFGVVFATDAITKVVTEHPGIAIELVTSTRPLTSRTSEYDLAISIGEPRHGWLASEFLTHYTLGLYASRDYLTRNGPVESVEDLSDHRLVFYVDSHLNVAELDLARGFAGMRVGIGCTNISAQVEATRLGAGIGLLPCYMTENTADLVRVLPQEVSFRLAYSLYTRRDTPAPQAVELLRIALRRVVVDRQNSLVPPV